MRTIEWAAGLFEGEGSVISRKRPEDQITATLVSTDADVVIEFARVVGVGKINGPYQYGERKPYLQWCAYGEAAVVALTNMRPYLLSRRAARCDDALKRYAERQQRPHYTVPRKGIGGAPYHQKNAGETKQTTPYSDPRIPEPICYGPVYGAAPGTWLPCRPGCWKCVKQREADMQKVEESEQHAPDSTRCMPDCRQCKLEGMR